MNAGAYGFSISDVLTRDRGLRRGRRAPGAARGLALPLPRLVDPRRLGGGRGDGGAAPRTTPGDGPADPRAARCSACRASRPAATRAACSRTRRARHAGRLIDELGLKGARRGGAVVEPAPRQLHRERPGAPRRRTCWSCWTSCARRVAREAGVELELEVKVWRPTGVNERRACRGRRGRRRGRLPLDAVADEPPSCGRRAARACAGRAAARSARAVLALRRRWRAAGAAGRGSGRGYAKVMASERLKVGQRGGAGQRLPLRGRGARAAGPRGGREHPGPRHRGAQGRGCARRPGWRTPPCGRTLPDTLQVDIRERVPLALAEVDRLYLMDERRRRSSTSTARAPPASTCPSCAASRASTTRRAATARSARARCSTTWASWRPRSPRSSWCPRATCASCCAAPARCCSWARRPTASAVLTFLGLRKELRERCPEAEYFDLRFRDRIYAKRRPPRPRLPRRAASHGPAPRARKRRRRPPPPSSPPLRFPPAAPRPSRWDDQGR